MVGRIGVSLSDYYYMTLRDANNIINGWHAQQKENHTRLTAHNRHFTWWIVSALSGDKITHQDILLLDIDPPQKTLSEEDVNSKLELWETKASKINIQDPFSPKK